MDRRLKYGLSVALAIALVVALMLYTGIDKIWTTLSQLNPVWFLPMIIVYAVDWLIRGLRWKIILKTCDIDITLQESTAHTLIGNTANLVVPAKLGDLARVYSIKKVHKCPVPVGLSSVFFDRIFDFIGVLIITITLFLMAPMVTFNNLPGWIMWVLYGAAGLMAAVLVLIALVIKKPAMFKRLMLGPLKRFSGIFDKLQESFRATVKKPSVLVLITSLSIVIWTMEALITYLLAIGLNIHVPVWMIFFTIMIANLTKTLPLTPGGIAIYEGVFSALFYVFGYVTAVGTTLGVIDHLFKNIFTIAAGGLAASWLGIRLTKISGDQDIDKSEDGTGKQDKKQPVKKDVK